MDNINSPKLAVTPIRRLGLSKRYSGKSPLINNIRPTHFEKTSVTPVKRTLHRECVGNTDSTPTKLPRIDEHGKDASKIPVDSKESNFEELLSLIETWKTGCKEALGTLQEWLATHEDKRLTNKQLAQQLGIWEVLKQHFENDSEVLGSDDDSDALEFEV